jgi:hypothetical protein
MILSLMTNAGDHWRISLDMVKADNSWRVRINE